MRPTQQRQWLWLILALVGITGSVAAAWAFFGPRAGSVAYVTAAVDRGPIQSQIAAAGSVKLSKSSDVLSEAGGEVVAIRATFNDAVTAGQVLATIEDKSLASKLVIAKADLEVARNNVRIAESQVQSARLHVTSGRADLDVARAGIQRAQQALASADREARLKTELKNSGDVPTLDVERAQTQLALSQSDVQQARGRESSVTTGLDAAKLQETIALANVENARATLAARDAALKQADADYANMNVRSPIDGVVIERAVEVGQTVRPGILMFVIGENLGAVEVHARVDEADITRVNVGQASSVNVDAYPGQEFRGRVAEIRKLAQNVQNIVNYIVVVAIDGTEQKLLPGMTAEVRIVTASRADVLRVSRAALRFTPPGRNSADAAGPSGERVWRVTSDDELQAVPIRTGLADAVYVEVVEGDVKPGDGLAVGASQKH